MKSRFTNEQPNSFQDALAILVRLRDHAPVTKSEMRRAAQIIKAVLSQESERLRYLQTREGPKFRT
jgi:hypothetical protein